MNVAMEQTKEFVNGQLTNSYGDTFIRGNNGKMKRKTEKKGEKTIFFY
jgi:small nuclear ribonucleoprotein (snRNP)-like protein